MEGNVGPPGDIEVGGNGDDPHKVGSDEHEVQKPTLARTRARVLNLGFDNKTTKHLIPSQIVDLFRSVIKVSDKNSFKA